MPRSDDHLVGGQDAHLHRQHQRHEDHPEHQAAEREAEVDDRERRQQRDRDLADGDDQRADQAHASASAPPAAALLPYSRLPAEQRQLVALEHVAAGQQRHRHVLHDLLGRVRAGDERDVDRKSDDRARRAISVEVRQEAWREGGSRPWCAAPASVVHLLLDVAELDHRQRDDDDHQHHRLRGRAAEVERLEAVEVHLVDEDRGVLAGPALRWRRR